MKLMLIAVGFAAVVSGCGGYMNKTTIKDPSGNVVEYHKCEKADIGRTECTNEVTMSSMYGIGAYSTGMYYTQPPVRIVAAPQIPVGPAPAGSAAPTDTQFMTKKQGAALVGKIDQIDHRVGSLEKK